VPVKKAAIFVEGQTELIFVTKMMEELAGVANIKLRSIVHRATRIITLSGDSTDNKKKYFVLLVDCQGDHSVKSAILERRPGLLVAGYELIVGLRDLYPLPKSALTKLEQGLRYGLPTAGCPTYICVAIMEVEAWFAQEHTHYTRIHPSLSKELIRANLGVDLDAISAEDIHKPSEFLDRAYRLVGERYSKKRSVVSRTTEVLDYANLFFNLRPKLPHFATFADYIEAFL
jgi:hypothetical protein